MDPSVGRWLVAVAAVVALLTVTAYVTLDDGDPSTRSFEATAFQARLDGASGNMVTSHMGWPIDPPGNASIQIRWTGEERTVPDAGGQLRDAWVIEAAEGNETWYIHLDQRSLAPIAVETRSPDLLRYPGRGWIQGMDSAIPFLPYTLVGRDLVEDEPVDLRFHDHNVTVTLKDRNTLVAEVPVGQEASEGVTYRFQLADEGVLPVNVTSIFGGSTRVRWMTENLETGHAVDIAPDTVDDDPTPTRLPTRQEPFDRWPPAGAGFPFPIEQAVEMGREGHPLDRSTANESVDRFFRDHPDACLIGGEYREFAHAPMADADRQWILRFSAPSGDRISFVVDWWASADPAGGVYWEVDTISVSDSGPCGESSPSLDEMTTLEWVRSRCDEVLDRPFVLIYRGDIFYEEFYVGGRREVGYPSMGCESSDGAEVSWDPAREFYLAGAPGIVR